VCRRLAGVGGGDTLFKIGGCEREREEREKQVGQPHQSVALIRIWVMMEAGPELRSTSGSLLIPC
jgi:hypothetical protein